MKRNLIIHNPTNEFTKHYRDYNDFYDENKEKRMQSRWLNLPLEKAKFILKGLLDTYGCNKNEFTFDNTSKMCSQLTTGYSSNLVASTTQDTYTTGTPTFADAVQYY